jgi:hypothetical protein
MNKNQSYNRRKFVKYVSSAAVGTLFFRPLMGMDKCISTGQTSLINELKHVVVAGKHGRFYAWPANNGMWTWDEGKEILIGYTDGPLLEQRGHNIGHPQLTKLARSKDGGKTWTSESPDNFVGDRSNPAPSPGNFTFDHRGFALRVAAAGYHGTDDPTGRFFVSYSRGKSWQGPFRFNDLNDDPNLEGMQITARTSYLVSDSDTCQLFMTARDPRLEDANRLDKPFVAETKDGGKTFQFVSWIVPWSDPYRAVMPSTVRTSNGKIVVATRRRNPQDIEQQCWIDCYVSSDKGRNWSYLSNVGLTGVFNGNPPGLTLLGDGRLACVYGNRSTRQMIVRFSDDEGESWSREYVIRDKPLNHDIGYPQITQNADGKIVAVYYLATDEFPHSHIEAAIWLP